MNMAKLDLGPDARRRERIFPSAVGQLGYLGHLALSHGFDSVAVVDIDRVKAGRIEPKITVHNLDEKLVEYIESSGDLCQCNLFEKIGETNVPFQWQTGIHPTTGLSTVGFPLEDQFDELLEAFDIRSGYCVPVHTFRSNRSVVIYFTKEEETAARCPELVLDTIECFEEAFGDIENDDAMSDMKFSSGELNCLTWCAQGKTNREISLILSLSEHTVNHYMAVSSTKLGAVSRANAVAKAIKSGLIDVGEVP